MWLLAYTIATTPPACWVTWRLAYRRGVDHQKRRHEQLRRYDEMFDPTRVDDVARENERAVPDGIDWSSPQARAGLDAIFDAIDALPADPPPLDLDVIDIRDRTDGARWN